MRGVLPCPKSDIMSNQLDPDIESVFACLGVDLKYLMEYFYIKKETKFYIDDNEKKKKQEKKQTKKRKKKKKREESRFTNFKKFLKPCLKKYFFLKYV
jgi:hypothetical protein